jgi:hypothetical protein
MVTPVAGPVRERPPLAVHLGGAYPMLIWVLLPFTFGIGSLALWLSALPWPRLLDHDGIVTRAGRRFLWKDLVEVRSVTVVQQGHNRRITGRLDLVFRSGKVKIVPHSLKEGAAVMNYVSSAVGRPVATG